VVEATQERLLDVVDSVRAAAVTSTCHIIINGVEAVLMSTLPSAHASVSRAVSRGHTSKVEGTIDTTDHPGYQSDHNPILKYWRPGSDRLLAPCNLQTPTGHSVVAKAEMISTARAAVVGGLQSPLDAICKRLRDKSLSVRTAAAEGLMLLLRECFKAQLHQKYDGDSSKMHYFFGSSRIHCVV
jgi:hypothetical protein